MGDYNKGLDFGMLHPFGRFPVAALLRALASHVPIGSKVELVTPIGDALLAFLEEDGEVSDGGRHKARVAWLGHDQEDSGLRGLAEWCGEQEVEKLAVWFTVFGPDGVPLLEAEDGNDTLFLGEAMSEASRQAVLDAVEVVGGGVSSGSLRQPRGSQL